MHNIQVQVFNYDCNIEMKELVCGKSCSFKLLQEIWPTGSFLNNNIIWLAHESDESMCKPSNLKEVTLSMVPVGMVPLTGLHTRYGLERKAAYSYH